MARAVMYVQSASMPKIVANEIIPNFKHVIAWKQNCKVLDVGCGPGNVTHDIFFPTLPKSVEQLVGIDKCPDFIEFAKSNYGKNSVMSFKVMDIVSDTVPVVLHEYFDYVVSFLCLHQFNNHKAAFNNIKLMLKPGGELFFYFPTTTKAFNMYAHLANEDKWKTYLRNYELYCSPYKDFRHCKHEMQSFFTSMGFKVLLLDFVEKKNKYFCKDFPHMHRVLTSIPIPDSLMDEFIEDSLTLLRNSGEIKLDNNNEEYFDFNYHLAIAHLIK